MFSSPKLFYLTRIGTYLFFTFVLPSVFNDIFTFLLCFTSSNRHTTHLKKQNTNLRSTRGDNHCTGLHVCLHHRKIDWILPSSKDEQMNHTEYCQNPRFFLTQTNFCTCIKPSLNLDGTYCSTWTMTSAQLERRRLSLLFNHECF